MERTRAILSGQSMWSALLGALLLLLFGTSVALVPIRGDNDCWWHVKTGKYIAENGLPHNDVFAFTAEEYEWHNHEWVTQLAMWKAFRLGESWGLGGWRMVTVAKTGVILLACLILYFLAGRLSRNWWIALLVASIALAVGRRTFYPRPPLVTNVLLAAEILLITGIHEKWWSRKWLLALPPMFAAWSNLHGGWMAGIVVGAAYAGADILYALPLPEKAKRLIHPSPEPVPWKWWVPVGLACVVATWANPFGWQLYAMPGRVLGDKALVSSLGELLPPDWRFMQIFLSTMVLLLATMVVLAAKRRLPLRLAEWAIWAFFLWQGVRHVRHLLLYGVMAVPLMTRVAMEAAALARGNDEAPARAAKVGACVLLLALAVQGATLRNWPEGLSYPRRNALFAEYEQGYLPWDFPAEQCDFIEAAVLEGRMFNENHYAGYLIWRFSPETHKVFSDPRFDIFGGAIWRQEVIVINALTPPVNSGLLPWRGILEEWDIQWMLIKGTSPLAATLDGEKDWVLAANWPPPAEYLPHWQIWIRNTPDNAAMIARTRRTFERRYGVRVPQ